MPKDDVVFHTLDLCEPFGLTCKEEIRVIEFFLMRIISISKSVRKWFKEM